MSIKDQVIDKIQEFQRLCHCSIEDMSPAMRENIRIQLGAEAESAAITENDHTFFQFDYSNRQLTANGIKVEIIPHMGGMVRVGVFV